jgi:hypothetical protein
MRSFDYVRTPPEPREGLVFLVVALVVVIMGPDLCARPGAPSTAFAMKIGESLVELGASVTR